MGKTMGGTREQMTPVAPSELVSPVGRAVARLRRAAHGRQARARLCLNVVSATKNQGSKKQYLPMSS